MLTVDEPAALPIRHASSFGAQPLKLSILMAAYNEDKTIAQVIDQILKAECPCEIELIIVDDGSTDGTPALLSLVDDPRVLVLRHPANQGKGAALLSAVSFATGTHVLPFDADLEYDPEDIPRVIEPVLKGRCDIVYGVRLPGFYAVYRTYLYAAANRLLTRLANVIFNAHLTDIHTCIKLMPLTLFKSLNLREKGFGLDSEITAGLLVLGIRPFEVPVSYYGRSHAEGKKIKWHDGIACVRILLWTRLRSRSRREEGAGRVTEGDYPLATAPAPAGRLIGQGPSSGALDDGGGAIKAVTA